MNGYSSFVFLSFDKYGATTQNITFVRNDKDMKMTEMKKILRISLFLYSFEYIFKH